VTTGVRRRSVGAQRALGRAGNSMSDNDIDAVVVNLIDRITGRMRAAGRTGRTVVLRLRFDDFTRATRSHTLPWATSSTAPVLAAARRLVADAAPLIAQRGLTLVGFAVSGIDRSGAQQLTLPFDDDNNRLAIDAAIDSVRERYGKSALTPAVLVGRDPGTEFPHLPD
jgi:DNA polymerase-4